MNLDEIKRRVIFINKNIVYLCKKNVSKSRAKNILVSFSSYHKKLMCPKLKATLTYFENAKKQVHRDINLHKYKILNTRIE